MGFWALGIWHRAPWAESSAEVVTALLACEDGGVASSESLLVRDLSDWSDLRNRRGERFQSLDDERQLFLLFGCKSLGSESLNYIQHITAI